jgi:hypothetical protein
LLYASETGGWQLGELDLSEYLDPYRDQRLVLIIAPMGQSAPQNYTCGICGFVMSEVDESHREAAHCPRLGWPWRKQGMRVRDGSRRTFLVR